MSHFSALLPFVLLLFVACANLGFGHDSGACPHHGSHDHGHDHHHPHHHHDHHHHHESHGEGISVPKFLPEELAEEEDLKILEFGAGGHHHRGGDHKHGGARGDVQLSKIGLWSRAMGCSLLVSMASLICLIMLPVIFVQGKPSKSVVDSLATFGAGAMLGDAFLHQLPHAFGGEHTHSHNHHSGHVHEHFHDDHAQSHSHSLKDLSVGLSILSGIVLFVIVEKIVRYVEENSGKVMCGWGHHHHHRHKSDGLKVDERCSDDASTPLINMKKDAMEMSNEHNLIHGEEKFTSEGKSLHETTNDFNDEQLCHKRRSHSVDYDEDKTHSEASNTTMMESPSRSGDDANGCIKQKTSLAGSEPSPSPSSLVFGYLNLFSDGVHNFTDGMALGSAFLLHGSVGGWSRTLFLLAHELPQEVGDFGILVRSGFSVSKALFFNFLSALVALAGTALALLVGQGPGQSSLIEGFTAGGFIYIAVAGVLPELNNGKASIRSSVIQLTSLILGMAVALCISLVE